MSKRYKTVKKQPPPIVSQRKHTQPKVHFLDRLENHLSKRSRWYIISCLILSALFSLLLFNVKISEGFDDSLYIEAGFNYAKGFFSYYYTYTAPLYCMFLALPIAIFGVNLFVLKSFSVIFFLLGIYFVYLAFKERIPYSVLLPALFLTALNTAYLYHASQTFTETFTLMVMGLVFIAWLYLDDKTMIGPSLRSQWKNYALFGFVIFIYCLSRNIALASVVAIFMYFLCYKKYGTALISIGAFASFYGLYQKIILPLAWPSIDIKSSLSGQGRMMLQKDAYNAGLGQEDLSGFITRFFENAKIYSSALMDMVGLKSDLVPQSYTYFIILIGAMIIGVVFAILKKNRTIVAVSIFCACLIGATFISLHSSWGQVRMIMIYIPFIAIVVFYGFWAIFKVKKIFFLQWLYPLLIIALLMVNLGMVLKEVEKNRIVLKKNLKGEKYYGYTPDWINYFLMSEYAAANTPDSVKIGCRKSSMSFVYSGCDRFAGMMPKTIVIDSALYCDYQYEFLATNSFFLHPQYENGVRKYMKYLIMTDKYYYVFDLPKEEKERMTQILKLAQIKTFVHPDSIKNEIASSKSAYATDLIELSNYLISRNIEYIIDASLRTNPTKKTGQVITTISRYMTFLKHKYLEYYELVHQNAQDDKEPAWLYKVNLNKIKSELGDFNMTDHE